MLFQELANLPAVEVIADDGSPSTLKLFMLWNPPLCLKTVRVSSLVYPTSIQNFFGLN